MRRLITIALVMGWPLAVAGGLDLGEPLPKSAVNLEEVVTVNPAQLVQAYRVEEHGRLLKIGWQPDKGVTYIQPEAESFATPEGARIGMVFKDIRALSREAPEKHPGYLFTVKLPSGWYAGFVQGQDHTEGRLQDESQVIVVFKSSWL